jgi:oligopeptide/dipeptide ABC transporter ATP-binding protein
MLLRVEGLTKHFILKRGIVQAVNGISFAVDVGETFGLVGESGCGKTTTGRAVLRLLEASSGRVFFEEKEILTLSTTEFRKIRCHMQIVFQSPFGSLDPRQKVKDILVEPLIINRSLSRKERLERVKELIRLVELKEEQLWRYPHEFSGGQRQRIGIARALALNPKLIVLDEPTSALDVSIQSQILNLLKELQRKFSLSYLFISHNLAVVEHLCDRVGVMYLGRILEMGPTEAIFENPVHPYTRAIMSATPDISQKRISRRTLLRGDVMSAASIPRGCGFHTRCPEIQGAVCQREEPPLVEVERAHFAACHLHKEVSGPNNS